MGEIRDDPRLRDREYVFSDRHDAGRRLGEFLRGLSAIPRPVVLAIPAGGVPVGRELASALHSPFSLAIVRKIRIPGTTESGFGAVAWDGEVLINEEFRAALHLSAAEVKQAVSDTRQNVRERLARFMDNRPPHIPEGATMILTDDGLASGFTMLAAIRSIRKQHPGRIIVAVPTGSLSAVRRVAEEADLVACLNIRSGRTFAVADAYMQWYDLGDSEVTREIRGETPVNGAIPHPEKKQGRT